MAKQGVFTVSLSQASDTAISVNYSTQNGTALAGVDYTATSGTLTFEPGEVSKAVAVDISPRLADAPTVAFNLVLSEPVGGTVTDSNGVCTIEGSGSTVETYLDRFNWTYTTMTAANSGFFGAGNGTTKNIPYHALENLIVEAPDWGKESVSETISFWGKLEAWNLGLNGIVTGYQNMWASVEANYIPSATNQPVGSYTSASPATFQPNENNPDLYPVLPNLSMAVGADPLYADLVSTYGVKTMYLMHWFYDVDGVYGFKNGDGTTKQVAINSFQRGLQESSWETVTQPEWENWANGGSTYGYLPLFSQSKPTYPSAPFDYGKQWRYTCAPDAEVRLIASSWLAHNFAADKGLTVSAQDTKAKKMGDYLRYSLYDKYFKPIGVESGTVSDGSGCHYQIGWYVSWGGEIPASGATGSWGFRIGSSEVHFGYNGVDVAYAMATSGGGYSPLTSGAADQWQTALGRQLEMIRWLQTPEGPIAGGCSNSWYDQYVAPTDGRESTTFYGMWYTYSPVWHDPPSNKWAGYQWWGLERVAAIYIQAAGKSDTFNSDIATKCGVILDRFVPWVLANSTVGSGTYSIPEDLTWTSPTAVAGETTTSANLEGVYEYIPTLTWPGTSPDYAAFWDASSVPNPTLKCIIADSSTALGEGGAMCQLLIEYCAAKVAAGGTLADTIPGSSYTLQNAIDLAKGVLDVIWNTFKDTKGFTADEPRTDYARYNDPIYIPPEFNGTMPNGDVLANGTTTFISMRSFMKDDADWPKIQAYLDNPIAANIPTFQYHRFWHTTDIAVAFGMMHHYFPAIAPS